MNDSAKRDDSYYLRYHQLSQSILRAYVDSYCLDSVNDFYHMLSENPETELKHALYIVTHICELAKADLALTLWKVFYDNNKNANTVKKLKQYLFDTYKIKLKLHDSESIKKIQKKIKDARHTFLAHNDLVTVGDDLQVADIRAALDDIRKYFNELVFPDIDNRVYPISDSTVYSISFYEKVSFNAMVHPDRHENSGGE